MMQYKLVYGAMLATVEDDVNEAAQLGWRPSGSLVHSPSKWVQPMVREIYECSLDDEMWTTTRAVAAEEDRKLEKELMG